MMPFGHDPATPHLLEAYGRRTVVPQITLPASAALDASRIEGWLALNGEGTDGFVLASGSMSSNQSGEGDIRRAVIEADLVDCMVALPGPLFYSTQIPVCLVFLTKNKSAHAKRGFRDRRKQTLFIDAREHGTPFAADFQKTPLLISSCT